MKKTLLLIRLRLARLWHVMLAVSCVGTAAGYAWWHFDVLDMSGDELASYDDGLKRFNNQWWFPWGQRDKTPDQVLVAVDDDTFKDIAAFPPWENRYGSWPYDRIIWADIIDYLSSSGAKVIVFDLLITENKPDPTGDQKLGEAIARSKVPVIVGFHTTAGATPLPKVEKPVNKLHQPKPAEPPPEKKGEEAGGSEEFGGEFPSEPTPEELKKAKAEELEKLRERTAPQFAFPITFEGGLAAEEFTPANAAGLPDGGLASLDDIKRDAGIIGIKVPQYPVPAIAQLVDNAAGFGLVDPEVDDDGKMRQTRFAYTDGVNTYTTLSTAVVADYWGADGVTLAPGKLTIGSHAVRINPDGTARVNYGGSLDDRFKKVSLPNVLRWRAAVAANDAKGIAEGEEIFKDKIVFIAVIAAGAGDQKATPFQALDPAVVKHMAQVDNLLHDTFILEAPDWASLLLAFVVALISVALVIVAQSFITDVGAPIFLTFAFFVITGGFITFTNIHILSAMPGMAGTLAALCATAYNRFLAGKDREFLKEAFSSYLDPDVLDQIVEGRKLPPLDGDEREITAFFSDIRGFSTFTEQLKGEPRKLMKLLHDYLSAVTPVLKEHGACIDKYIGDAVVALFGAPHYDANHALNACRAALAVQVTIAELRKEFAKVGLPDVYTRVGLNTDVMLVGNMGSRSRPLNYTAIGDGMNLAARLEGTNKAYETLILIGPKTADAVKGKMVTRELDSIRVAGKNDAVVVYELVGEEGQVPPEKLKVLDLYAKALELYRHKRFPDSLRTLKEAYDLDNTDGPTKVLAGKCNQFMQHPPPDDWDGVTQLEK